MHLVTRFLRAPAIDVTDGDDLDIGPPEKARQIGVEDLTPRADEAEVDATAGGDGSPGAKDATGDADVSRQGGGGASQEKGPSREQVRCHWQDLLSRLGAAGLTYFVR